ncbi:transposase [Rhodobacter maris]|uniref:transposase n=1 Tax=Rhodobacter maris TaxID=446682 RepID=UPI000BE3F7BE
MIVSPLVNPVSMRQGPPGGNAVLRVTGRPYGAYEDTPRIQVWLASDKGRRRRWTDAEKVRIVEERYGPGMTLAEVARPMRFRGRCSTIGVTDTNSVSPSFEGPSLLQVCAGGN